MFVGSKDLEDDLFLSAVQGAEPLADRQRARPPQRETHRPTSAPDRKFAIERRGERIEGRSHGVSRKQLASLRAGHIRPESTLDLHRTRADDAARKLEAFIAGAAASGLECVLVIHGRGLHSEAGPVLRDRVIRVLSSGRTAAHVRAFCSASGRDGGVGAMYVVVKQS